MQTDNLIILFTKYPSPGHAKTRLIPSLGAKGAALLQKWMTEIIVATLSRAQKIIPHTLEIHYTQANLETMQNWLGSSHHFCLQPNSSLGSRMHHAALPHLQKKQAIIIMGADCPNITESILEQAFTALCTHQVVIGPSYDGGYYLIGMNQSVSSQALMALFSDISWGTGSVCAETIEKIQQLNLNHHLLQKLHDIDTPEDLGYIDYYSDPQ